METTLPMFLLSLMRHNAKAQIIGIWIIPVDKIDELLFSVCGVETGDWYVSMGEMNKILKQGLDSGEQTVMTLNQDRQRGESPSQANWGWSLGRPY